MKPKRRRNIVHGPRWGNRRQESGERDREATERQENRRFRARRLQIARMT